MGDLIEDRMEHAPENDIGEFALQQLREFRRPADLPWIAELDATEKVTGDNRYRMLTSVANHLATMKRLETTITEETAQQAQMYRWLHQQGCMWFNGSGTWLSSHRLDNEVWKAMQADATFLAGEKERERIGYGIDESSRRHYDAVENAEVTPPLHPDLDEPPVGSTEFQQFVRGRRMNKENDWLDHASKRIQVVVTRKEANFDRACDHAFDLAVNQWSKKLVENNQSTLHVRFESYEREASPVGHTHVYIFSTWVEKEQEESE